LFAVSFGLKNHSHPAFGTGSVNGYIINGVQGMELTLIRGITYTFSVSTSGHPFFISTSSDGGPANLASEVTVGVTNSMTVNGNLTFTPDANHPSLLYYQCAAHSNMGWKINIVDQLPDADLNFAMAGNYEITVTDASGCSAPILIFTISEPPANIFYYDADSDTYGIDAETALACTAPAGFVSSGGDCNDNEPQVNPVATEICNGIDDDCDGFFDDEDPDVTGADLYADSDGDNFGDPNSILVSCIPVQGYVSDNTDCDDADGNVHPGVAEDCFNLLDDDCDGGVDNCSITFNIKVFISGFYAGGSQMTAVADPFNFPNVCDTIKISLANNVSPYNILYTEDAVIDINGNGTVQFPLAAAGLNYYVVINHRNSITTWSKSPLFISDNMIFDLTGQ
jgi:hypothetical protein